VSVWPWEHVAFGYILYTLTLRALVGRRPTDREAIVLLWFTQVPDLVDKPLAWQFDVLPAGLSVAHSLFAVIPVIGAAILLARRSAAAGLGSAVAVGYSSHLLGDALYPWVLGSSMRVGFLLWPVVPVASDTAAVGFVAHVAHFAEHFLLVLSTGRGAVVIGLEIVLLGGAVWLWVRDGRPGVRTLGAATSSCLRALR
jgi:hypothetical protein